jgi:ribosomal protein S18 acetylase RimI-like enzyme
MLARAFLNDPMYEYIFPEAETRQDHIAWDMANLLRYGLRFGEVTATPDLAGCTIWLPPGETEFTSERMAQAGMLDAASHLGEQANARMERFITATELNQARLVPQPHEYLLVLGVDPARQGQGIGSALLASILNRASAGRLPVYLETTKQTNLAFYERQGFNLLRQEALPAGGPPVWYMVRDP